MGALSLRQSSAIAAQRIDDDAEPIAADIEAGRALLGARLLDLLGGCDECGEPGCLAEEHVKRGADVCGACERVDCACRDCGAPCTVECGCAATRASFETFSTEE